MDAKQVSFWLIAVALLGVQARGSQDKDIRGSRVKRQSFLEVVGFVSSVPSLYNSISSKVSADKGTLAVLPIVQQMQSSVSQITMKLKAISIQLANMRIREYDNLEALVKDALSDIQFFQPTSVPISDAQFQQWNQKNAFLYQAIENLMNGILGKNQGSSILQTVTSTLSCNGRNIYNTVSNYMTLVNAGIAGLAFYTTLQSGAAPPDPEVVMADLSQKYSDILKATNGQKLQCQSDLRNVGPEMTTLMNSNSNQDTSYVADAIYNFLSDKYDLSHWLVVVYDDMEGYDNHELNGNFVILHVGGKCSSAYPFAPSHQPVHVSQNKIDQYCQLCNIQGTAGCFVHRCDKDSTAQSIFGGLWNKGSITPGIGNLIVVRNNHSLVVRADPSLDGFFNVQYNGFTIIAF